MSVAKSSLLAESEVREERASASWDWVRQVMADGIRGPVLGDHPPTLTHSPGGGRGGYQPGLWAMFWTAEISPHTHQSCSISHVLLL